jgi:DNA-binding NarL/FixJ family response regulator
MEAEDLNIENKVTTIVFRPEEDNKTILETKGFESSLFLQQYAQTLSILQRTWDNKEDADGQNDSSNVIAFCGDRGEGKTSCLRSMRYILTSEVSLKKMKPYVEDLDIDANSIYALELLDPSYFDDTHNVIELVMGQLFEIATSEANQEDFDINARKTLMQRFQKAKACMTALKTRREVRQYDEMEELTNFAASVQLRKAIKNLFAEFLKYYRKKKLLICVDDLDMNMQYGYQMVEDIRKYLCTTNCIVFVAVKIEQLTQLVQSSMEEAINGNQKKVVPVEQIENMAQKYVDKFIPENHRIKMPTSHSIAEQDAEVYVSKDTLFREENTSTKETIVRLIFDKTRYLFYNSRTISPIVPSNLRAIRQLLGLLVSMPSLPYTEGEEKLEKQKEENKKLFRTYFYQSWIKNLTQKDQIFAKQLAQYEDVISVNKFVVSYLGERMGDGEKGYLVVQDDLWATITRKENKSHNISVGDVYYIMRQIEAINTDQEIALLLFFIRSFYSMSLYARYDELIKNLNSAEESSETNKKKVSVSIYKYDKYYEGTNTLQKLLNGSYFTYEPGTLITDVAITKVPKDSLDLHRDHKPIDGNELGELLVAVNKDLKEHSTVEQYSDLYYKMLRCEYFILTTLYQIDTSKSKVVTVKLDRNAVEPPFIGEYDNIKKSYLAFDFLAIFYNLVNLKYAFYKFGEEGRKFWGYVTDQPHSLYRQMIDAVIEDRNYIETFGHIPTSKEEMHQLLSDAIIRVSEVQLAIIDTLNSNRLLNKHRDNGDNTYKLQSAYDDITKLGISLYPDKDGNNYQLSFAFLQPVIQYLKEENEDAFNQVFNCNAVIQAEVEEILSPENFSRDFPSINNAKTIQDQREAIKLLRLDAPNLPKERDAFWNSIFTKAKYRGKNKIIITCLTNYHKLKRYL